MKYTIKQFWYNLLQKLDKKINQWLNKVNNGMQEIRANDTDVVNVFVMILKKVLNHVFMQCSFEVVSDSVLVKPLMKLCDDLQDNCYKIGAYMLGGSDTSQNISECWVVPYFEVVNGQPTLFHSYLRGDKICITGMTGNRITECYMIIDAVQRNEKTYFLCRQHTLSSNGDLKITFFVADEQAQEVSVDIVEWNNVVQNETIYAKANNIGFGRYKSPVISFGDDTYGKPLNYGCAVVEQRIQKVLSQIQLEFRSKETKLFPDWSIVKKKDKDGNPIGMHCIDEYIYPVQHRAGLDSKLIDEFSPAIRESSYYTHLTKLLEQYQALIGVNELITKEKSGNNATATEIRALNTDNMSLEDNIRKAMREGNVMTLEADCIYLGIRSGLWAYDETWTDIYDDEQQRLKNMLDLYSNEAVEQIDLIKYWYPTLTEEEAQEKLERIKRSRQDNMQTSIERMLTNR